MHDWQYPCITERQAALANAWCEGITPDIFYKSSARYSQSSEIPSPYYLGLPWATYIDKHLLPHTLLENIRSRIHTHRLNAARSGIRLEIHTVCQHIWWERLLPVWRSLGITDVHLSHLPESGVPHLQHCAMRFHPWHLYAVNVEDATRRDGLVDKPELADRRYLASFIGAHGHNYLSDVRQRLLQHANEPDCIIEVTGTRWHFEGAVYDHQIKGLAYEQSFAERQSIRRYNEVLSESQFALCPSGTGPNSLRLWESLALGCIPVLLGKRPALPDLTKAAAPHLPDFDWSGVVLVVEDDDVPDLIRRLRAMPQHERQLRSIRAKQAYAWVRDMRCFSSPNPASSPALAIE